MTDNIVDFTGLTTLDVDPDKVLNAAIGELDSVMVLGWDKEGVIYLAANFSDVQKALWLAEKLKYVLMMVTDEGE